LSKAIVTGWYWAIHPLARGLAARGVTADMVTWASLAFGAFAGIAMGMGHFGLGTLLGAVGCLCDAIDGLVARFAGNASDSGEVLDAAVDRYTEVFFLGGVIIYYRSEVYLIVLGLLALLGGYMISYSTAKAEALAVNPPRGWMRRHERAAYLLVASGLASLSIAWVEPVAGGHRPMGIPMIVGLALVGLVANVSAIRRLTTIAALLRVRAACPSGIEPTESLLSFSEARPR
jgi:CDP-diacylglycerol--glycerol-3-phosphate 3-phosphatidyltransferase